MSDLKLINMQDVEVEEVNLFFVFDLRKFYI